jgi:hypothetical protein
VLVTSRRLIYPSNWEFLDTLFKLSKNLNVAYKSYLYKGYVHDEDIFHTVKNSIGTLTKAFKWKEGTFEAHLIVHLYSVYQLTPVQWSYRQVQRLFGQSIY